MRISGVNVGKVKTIDLSDDGRTERDDRARRPVRADAQGQPRDPAPEDAARRDLHRAHAGHRGRRQDPGGRAPRDRPGRAHRGAGRDLPRVRQEDPRGLPDLAAGPRQGHRGPRRRLLGLPRRAAGVREQHQRGAEDPELPGARHAGGDQEHRHGVRRAHRARGPAQHLDHELQPPARDDGQPRRGDPRDLAGVPRVHHAVAADAEGPRGLRREHGPADARRCARSAPSSATCS